MILRRTLACVFYLLTLPCPPSSICTAVPASANESGSFPRTRCKLMSIETRPRKPPVPDPNVKWRPSSNCSPGMSSCISQGRAQPAGEVARVHDRAERRRRAEQPHVRFEKGHRRHYPSRCPELLRDLPVHKSRCLPGILQASWAIRDPLAACLTPRVFIRPTSVKSEMAKWPRTVSGFGNGRQWVLSHRLRSFLPQARGFPHYTNAAKSTLAAALLMHDDLTSERVPSLLLLRHLRVG